MIVKISINAVEHYLGLMMSLWISEHDVESEVLENYKECALAMQNHIKLSSDEKYIQLAFAHLISSNDIPQRIWDGFEDECNYVFVEFEFKEIVEYAYSVLWPNTQPKNTLKGYEIEFIKTGIDLTDWYSVRDELNPLFNKKS
jgi:hypothetical protein